MNEVCLCEAISVFVFGIVLKLSVSLLRKSIMPWANASL